MVKLLEPNKFCIYQSQHQISMCYIYHQIPSKSTGIYNNNLKSGAIDCNLCAVLTLWFEKGFHGCPVHQTKQMALAWHSVYSDLSQIC